MGNRWETVEIVADLIFEGSKITADGDCSHEVKKHLLLGRKVKKLLYNRGNSKQGEKTAFRMEENNSK